MRTLIVKDDLSSAIDLLKKGEPVIFPTETVYGLGAPLFDLEAVKRIFEIKGRPLDNPLIAHVATLEQAVELGEDLSPDFFLLADRFWPGPLTLVVRRKSTVPSFISAGHPTLAIRMPSHPIARKLIEGVGKPLAAPSANLSGRPSPTSLKDALEDLEGRVKLAIDGGECSIGIESTVLSLFHPVPTLLRPGIISKETLEDVLKTTIALPVWNGPAMAPGMKHRHYAPKAPIRLISHPEESRSDFLLSSAPVPGKTTRPLRTSTFYTELREADRLGISLIEILCDPSIDPALMDRILRASGNLDILK